jgi:hypothetical protein
MHSLSTTTRLAALALAAVAAGAQQPLLNQYCIGCHNPKLSSGGLSLASLDLAHASRNAAE